MVGTALKKYAEAHGMTCDGGYVYGKVNGRHIALLDGAGVKMLQIFLHPPAHTVDEAVLLQAKRILESDDRMEYRLIRRSPVNIGRGRAVVVFQDGPGAIKRVARYIDAVVPRLEEVPLDGDVCACCGEAFDEETRYLLMDDYILPVHRECLSRMSAQMDVIRPAVRKGSLVKGSLGAFAGAVLGAAVWVVVYLMGYIAGIAGLLIGYLSNLLYERFGGRNGRARVWILLIAVAVGILLGQVGGMTAMMCRNYDEEGGMGALYMTRGEYVRSVWEIVLLDNREQILGNMYDRVSGNFEWYEKFMLTDREEFVRTAWSQKYEAMRAEMVGDLFSELGTGMFLGIACCMGLLSKISMERGCRIKQLQ